MAWGTLAERRSAVESLALKAEARAKEHRAREASYRAQGKAEKAEKHAATAKRQERIALTHRQELDRLALRARQQAYEGLTAAQRAHEMARAKERAAAAAAAQPAVDPLHAYTEALETAAGLDEDAKRLDKNARAYARSGDAKKAEISTRRASLAREREAEWRGEADRIQAGTSRDLARELAAAVKAKRRAESKAKIEAKRLADLGIAGDLATAAGQREIASGGAGRGNKVASLRDYASLIRKPQERTQPRLKAMEEFDNLCGTADAGLFPEPRFEHESGSGQGPGAMVMMTRAAGLAEMQQISDAIGARNVEMLRAWIYERQTLIALVRAGYGSEKAIGALTLAAVDALAVYLRTRSALAAQMTGMGLPSQPRPSDAATASRGYAQSQVADTEISNSQASRVSRSQPEIPRFSSNHLPAGDRPRRPTISCPEPISDDARRTIQARRASRAQA